MLRASQFNNIAGIQVDEFAKPIDMKTEIGLILCDVHNTLLIQGSQPNTPIVNFVVAALEAGKTVRIVSGDPVGAAQDIARSTLPKEIKALPVEDKLTVVREVGRSGATFIMIDDQPEIPESAGAIVGVNPRVKEAQNHCRALALSLAA